MDERFSANAARLAGLTARHLGWLPQHFWQATPTELAAIFSADPDAPPAPLERSELDALLENDKNG
tara:strand:+ start:715 stop:912 length:198 start_codon:yes stop_codon:yes gene_type:complete